MAGAQSWVFDQGFSDTDLANLKADTQNWTDNSTYYANAAAITDAQLTANGATLDATKGLYFTNTKAGAVRIDFTGKRITLNNTQTIAIKGLKAGQKITVSCKSSSKTTERGMNAENVTPVSGSFNATSLDNMTNVGTVTADGDVKLSNTGGLYLYSITVEAGSGSGSDAGGSTGGNDKMTNAVAMNTNNNQVNLLLQNNDMKYYDTQSVASININDSQIDIVPTNSGLTNDTYNGSVKEMYFTKAADQGQNGSFSNESGKVVIKEAKGWLESLYVTFEKFEGANSYNVYVKGGQYAQYTKIDYQLVRNYGTYGRADAVGLQAGTYAVKIVPVINGAESAAAANEATSLTVENYDRSGFAHKGLTEGIGAYNLDGTLKANAKVLYITKQTAKTVKTKVHYDKADTEFTGLQAIIDAYQKGTDTTPIAFRFIGLIEKADLDAISSSAEGLQIKGKGSYSTMNMTFEGIGDDATTRGFGFLLHGTKSVEMRNFANMLCMDDGVSIDTDNQNIWIHNLDMFYGQPGSAADQVKGDGTIDIKADSKFVTVSANHFYDNGKSSLCGMKSESNESLIDYHHNWFDHSDSRHPRIRTMSVHIWNNYFDGNAKYGVGTTMGSSAFVESNYYRNVKYPMMISGQGTDAKGDGTFSGETGGMIKSFSNVFAEQGTHFSYIPHTQSATNFDAYEAATRDESVPSTYKCVSGDTSYNNFDTDPAKMHTYTPDAANDVPAKVTGFYGAGRMNHGDFKWTFTKADDASYDVNAALKAAITNYKTSLVGIFDGTDAGNQGTTDPTPGDDGSGSGQGGSGSGDNPGTVTPAEGTVLCDFEANAPSSNLFTISGNYSTSKGTATVDGKTYTHCLKMESATTIDFTTTKEMKMTLYFADTETASVKINGTAQVGTSSSLTANVNGAVQLTKKNTGNLFLIKLEEIK